jgi:DNA polymerase I-like protein with 3'-5' exonuclease and polymerase domains
MDILTLDFETHYSQAYSLSKMTTEEYVRDPRFEAIGISVQVNDEPPEWCSGGKLTIGAFLRQYDWDNCVAVAHNAMFDMAILSWRFGIRPKRIADTLSMARALLGTEVGGSLKVLVEHFGLGAKGDEVIHALGKRRIDFSPDELARYGDYCCNDTALTYKLFQRMCKGFPVDELRLIDLTIRMFTEPTLLIDSSLLTEHLRDVRDRKADLLNRALFDKDRLMSNDKLAELLREMGVEPPMKVSPRTGKDAFAFSKTDEEFKALLEHENPLVQAVVAARLGVKSTLEETRTERFLQIAERGTLPVQLRYYAAHTGRWGGDGKLNLQNLPRGGKLKKSILAPDGYVIIDSDSSQIEARTLAWLAEQDDLVAAFDAGEDVYRIMASAIYGKDPDDISKDERFVGKTTILGCGYGMGHKRFKLQLMAFGVVMPEEECARIISVYRETYPAIPLLWKQADKALRAITQDRLTGLGLDGVLQVEGDAGIRLPNGLYIRYPGLRWEEGEKDGFVYDFKRGRATFPKGVWGGAVVENVCQALARIVIGEQMIRVSKKYKPVITVHDAIGALAPKAEEKQALAYVEECMRTRPVWAPTLPLNCEAGSGASYGDC